MEDKKVKKKIKCPVCKSFDIRYYKGHSYDGPNRQNCVINCNYCAKQKEMIELLDRYFLSKTRPSLDEIIECEDLKSELAELEQETTEDELYKRVYIKTEADLPEKEGIKYEVMFKIPRTIFTTEYWWKHNTDLWLQNIAWYLLPIEQGKTAMEQVRGAFEPIQLDKEHSEKLGEKIQPSVENCDNDCNGPDCEGCSDFMPKEQQPNKEVADMSKHIEAIFKNTQRIHGKSELDWIKVASYKAVRYINTHYAEACSKKSRRKIIEDWMKFYYDNCGGIDYYTKKYIDEYLNPKP